MDVKHLLQKLLNRHASYYWLVKTLQSKSTSRARVVCHKQFARSLVTTKTPAFFKRKQRQAHDMKAGVDIVTPVEQ